MEKEFNNDLIKKIDDVRFEAGYLTLPEIFKLIEQGNKILSPLTCLISREVKLGVGNLIYPSVIIEIENGGKIEIGDNNIFFPNSFLLADKGLLNIGNNNTFGDGGVSIKANMQQSIIKISDYCRFLNGVEIIGLCNFGKGAQIIGRITVQNCDLGGGEPFTFPDPSKRGGLIKGGGLARDLKVPQGQVIEGYGKFEQTNLVSQLAFHPKNPKS